MPHLHPTLFPSARPFSEKIHPDSQRRRRPNNSFVFRKRRILPRLSFPDPKSTPNFFCLLDCTLLVLYTNIKHLSERSVCVTDTNRMKKAAEWFYSNVFKDETIRPRAAQNAERVPPLIRTARSLENGMAHAWQSRESIFIKQAKLLALYEDDYAYDGNVVRYFPTYQSLTDQELRGYFSWRTKLRKGDLRSTCLSFAFLYVYELLNQIGVTDPMDGYRKLKEFRDTYGQIDAGILLYMDKWLADYVVYYGLDANLLADTPQVVFDRSITILDNIRDQDAAKVIYAVKALSTKWLDRSKFYAAYPADCDAVIVRVLRRVSDHYATRCKRTMVEQYFGPISLFQIRLFDSAVFYDQQKNRNCEYAVDERCVYRCQNGLWTVRKHSGLPRPNAKLGELLKTIDSVMRQEYAYGHPIKCETDIKWLLGIIREEVRALLAEKKTAEAKKITIDYSQLARIRRDAAITQDKLTVEDTAEPDMPDAAAPAEPEEPLSFLPAEPVAPAADSPLDQAEYRLLQCLLYGRDCGWVQSEGHILSVLVDGINEKLYDEFMDSVLDDTPELVEDYIDELKEMVHP